MPQTTGENTEKLHLNIAGSHTSATAALKTVFTFVGKITKQALAVELHL